MERTRRSADVVLALAVAQGLPHDEAAKRAHVSSATLTRRKKEPAFLALVEACRAELWREAVGLASRHVQHAVATLIVLLDKEQTPAIRLQAASRILDLVSGHLAHASLEQRVIALEAQGDPLEYKRADVA
ncbi:MAG TPA: hypothetical protein VII06_33325 [Chloroflexota bacterium]